MIFNLVADIIQQMLIVDHFSRPSAKALLKLMARNFGLDGEINGW